MSKPKVLLVADVPGWIFERHCQELKKRLSDDFEFSIGYRRGKINQNEPDLIYAMEYSSLENPRFPEKTLCGIRAEFRYHSKPNQGFWNAIKNRYAGIHVVNERMVGHFASFGVNLLNLPHGVDTELFTGEPREQTGELVCGWTGSNRPDKGRNILEKLNIPGVKVLCHRGQGKTNKSKEQMVEYYRQMDVYVCASATEGHNNPLMEAGAMARVLISTKTGSAPEYIEDGINGFLVERDSEAFKKAIEYLRDNRDKVAEMGLAAQKVVRERWSWKVRAEAYRKFFWDHLQKESPSEN